MSRTALRTSNARFARRMHRVVSTESALTPVSTGLLQRKCACGGTSALKGECEGCRGGKANLQRRGNGAGPSTVPRIVHNVLRSSGEPLDASTRGLMETRLGHDFGQVRVHTDARAAESAAAVSALAYTVGRNIVFAGGHYAPSSTSGQQLIAHELTHVMQQEKAGSAPVENLALDTPHDQTEVEATRAATGYNNSSGSHASSPGGSRLQRQPAPPEPAAAPEEEPAKPVENCPFPSDFKDDNEAAMNMMCIASAASEKAPSCNLTEKHFELINTAKESARKRVEKANSRMSWFGGPEYAERIGTRVFKGTPPGAKTIKETLGKMVQILGSKSLRFNGATCADPLCESKGQHAAAYESGPTEPVTLCPRSFLPSYLAQLPRTIIHEAVHLAGIDIDPDIEERYCDQKGCDEPCQDATSADAWALFIDCIGGPLIKPKTETTDKK